MCIDNYEYNIYNSVYHGSKGFNNQLAREFSHLFSFAGHWVSI